MRSKLLTALVALMVVVGSFAACGNDEAATTTAPATETVAAETEAAETEAAAE